MNWFLFKKTDRHRPSRHRLNNDFLMKKPPCPYLDITSWSHKKLIDLIRAEFPKDVLWKKRYSR